jgi:hypothetical protein
MTRLPFLLSLFLMVLVPFAALPAQATSSAPVANLRDGSLPAGKKVTDSKGRVITNGGANENGKLQFRYSGKLKTLPNGDLECSGEVPEVTNPRSQGSNGPVIVNTDGEPTTINLNRNGTDPGGHIDSTITGGNATVNVNGNFNDTSVGGTGNTVNFNGGGCTGQGQAGSGGTVNMGGAGNAFNGGGGNWTVRN